MDFTLKTEEFSPTDDQSWLGSRYGVGNTRTINIKLAALGPAHKLNGWVRSGIPLAIDAQGNAVPLGAANATDGTQILAGFLFAAVKIPSTPGATLTHGALLDHGRVIAARLPVAVPAAQRTGNIIFQ